MTYFRQRRTCKKNPDIGCLRTFVMSTCVFGLAVPETSNRTNPYSTIFNMLSYEHPHELPLHLHLTLRFNGQAASASVRQSNDASSIPPRDSGTRCLFSANEDGLYVYVHVRRNKLISSHLLCPVRFAIENDVKIISSACKSMTTHTISFSYY